MAQPDTTQPDDVPDAGTLRRRRNWMSRILLVLFLLLVAALLYLWSVRTELAERFIDDRLAQYDLPITYSVESIGPDRQVLTDVVVGPPSRPDLTIDRVEVNLAYRITGLQVGQVEIIRPRLWGRVDDDGVSFGSLDAVLFDREATGVGMPDLNVAIDDGRARIDTPAGPVGLKMAGQGVLSNGFLGTLAVNAPRLDADGCSARDLTLFGKLTITRNRPRISGPARLAEGRCGTDLAVTGMAMPVVLTADDDFAGGNATFDGEISGLAVNGIEAGRTGLAGRLEYGDGRLVGSYDANARALSTSGARARRLVVGGSVRSGENLAGWDIGADATLEGIEPEASLTGDLRSAAIASRDTLLGPVLARFAGAVDAQLPGSILRATLRYRTNESGATISVPQARLANAGGSTIGSITRASAVLGAGVPRLSGNVALGGAGLPQIEGRMERGRNGRLSLKLSMAEYGVGADRIAIPAMTVRQTASGDLVFSGDVRANGRLPGGRVRGLQLPLSGRWSRNAGLALWNECTSLRFDRLVYANLSLDRQNLTLCPPSTGPILQAGSGAGPAGFRFAAGITSLRLSGVLGETRLRLASGPVGIAWPGSLVARELDVELGPPDTGVRFALNGLTARLGGELGGNFEGADVRLASVPLDIFDANGLWTYREGTLALSDGDFRLEDREETDRFEPLFARGATLALADNRIRAQADLRTPVNEALVTSVDIEHDLATGSGQALLDVPGVTFTSGLQPENLSQLALGVVANTRGTVTGSGRIEWDQNGVSSTGRFASQGLDLAAAFGPVRGLRGEVVFSDLLGLTTAPDQRLAVRSINPGIEVFDGTVQFDLTGGEVLSVEGGSWPFLGGTLEMRPIAINIGQSETRAYTFRIIGLEAAELLERLDLANFSASGTYDGQLAIVFDEIGNGRIDDGLLVSRPPGGTLSYVGELTYEDLSPIANFAFDALKSLRFERMEVGIEGPLTGEILTSVRFDGVSQGEGASRNFITRRLARLPLQFNVNIRAPFYQLLTNIRSIYDPAYVRDPRELGLIDDEGAIQTTVQTPESDSVP